MKTNCIHLFMWLMLSFLFCGAVKAQGNLKELAGRIGNTRNFNLIQQIAKAYFEEVHREEALEKNKTSINKPDQEEEFENAETFYHRWAWFNGARLDANGNITDYNTKNLAALATEMPLGNGNNNSFGSNSSWFNEGPHSYTAQRLMIDGQGRTDCIAFHPTDANTMYAGTPMGGLWKTTDGGAWWTQVGGLYPFLGISGIVVNKLNGNEVWALTGTGERKNTWGIFAIQGGCRVYHSIDGGVNWEQSGDFPGIGGSLGHDLIQHPGNTNTLFAATQAGVYITTNAGATWSITGLTAGVYDLEIGGIFARLFATGPGFVKYSDNLGTNWTDCSFNVPIAGMNRASIAVSSASIGTIYLLAGAAGAGNFYGLYKSTNTGTNFTRQSNSPNIFDTETNGFGDFDQSGYDNCIVAHQTDVAKILTGGAALWESTNSGVTMTFNTYYWNSAANPTKYVHPDIHALKRNPLNNNIYACTDGGIYVSTDFGANWSKKTDGLSAAQIFHMTTYKDNYYMEAFGSQDNGLKIRRMFGLYEQFEGADGYAAQFSLNDSSILYASYNDRFKKYGSSGSTNLAITYPFVTSADKFYILPKVAPSATNTEILFAAVLDTLSRSTNGGSSWTRIVHRANWDITYAPNNPAYIYTAGGDNYSAPAGFTLSRNASYGTGAWTDISGTLGSFGQRAMKIVVAPHDALRIYVCLGGYTNGQKVYRSLNGGATWSTNISYNLPNVPVNALAADNAGNVYAGTDIGVYVLPAGTTQWVAFYNGLPRVPITDLIVNETHGFMKASTFGCGIWKTDLYGGCPSVLSVSNNHSGNETFEASSFINAPQLTMSGGNGLTDIRLRAGDKIIFGPGSNLQNGTMVASIGPCGVAFPNIVPIQRNSSDKIINAPTPQKQTDKSPEK